MIKVFPKAENGRNTPNPGVEEIRKKRQEFQLQSGQSTGQKDKRCCLG